MSAKEKTRSDLVAARVIEVDKNYEEKAGLRVDCMFNPFEYRVTKSNTFQDNPKNRSDCPQGEFTKGGSQTLTLKLIFDTYETGDDVSKKTNELWKFMMVKENKQNRPDKKASPPLVAFEWGVFRFVSFITNMTQTFTLFKTDGTPVRASVDVTFTQYNDVDDYPGQNPSSGGGPAERIRLVVSGDRLDAIAAEEYQDATKWRLIADHNHISNPLALKAGTYLRIPLE